MRTLGILEKFWKTEDLNTPADRPTPGIFYLLPTPVGWKLEAFPFDGTLYERSHEEYWEVLVRVFILFWGKTLKKSSADFQGDYSLLRPCPHALPRGTVMDVQGWHVFWGNDFPVNARITHFEIERVFGLQDLHVHWVESDADRCVAAQKQRMRAYLGLEDDWPAI